MAILRPSHPDAFPESAIQVCLALQVLFGLPLRQTAGLVASLLERAGLDWPVRPCRMIRRSAGGRRTLFDHRAEGDLPGSGRLHLVMSEKDLTRLKRGNRKRSQSAAGNQTPLQAMKDWHKLLASAVQETIMPTVGR